MIEGCGHYLPEELSRARVGRRAALPRRPPQRSGAATAKRIEPCDPERVPRRRPSADGVEQWTTGVTAAGQQTLCRAISQVRRSLRSVQVPKPENAGYGGLERGGRHAVSCLDGHADQ